MTYSKPEGDQVGVIDRLAILAWWSINCALFLLGRSPMQLPFGGMRINSAGATPTQDGGPADTDFVGRDS